MLKPLGLYLQETLSKRLVTLSILNERSVRISYLLDSKLPLKSPGLRDYKRRAYIRGASNRNRKSVPLTAIYKYTVF